MSLVSYNGIVFPYANITQFDQSAVYDDMGETDFFLTRFEIRLNAVINSDYMSLLAPTLSPDRQPVTDIAADIMNVVRKPLMTPRKTLSVKFNGVELIPGSGLDNPATRGTVDASNGPQPQSCTIVPLTNKTFLVSYHIIAHYWENNLSLGITAPFVSNRTGNDVLFNRWSETVEVDNANYTTRTRTGKYRIRSDNADGFQADQLRSRMAVVGVPAGFNRASSQYTISPDGLAISYNVVDKEVFKNPPQTAFTADGEYTETATRFDAKRFGDVWVDLRGSKTTDQAKLLETAILICTAKLDINGAPLVVQGGDRRKPGILESAEAKVWMYDNRVRCHMRAWIDPRNRRINGVLFLRNAAVSTPFSDPQGFAQTPNYLDRGTAGLLLQAAKYYDPSLRNTQLGTGTLQAEGVALTGDDNSQLNAGLLVGEAGVRRET